jgi:hypothetical protein
VYTFDLLVVCAFVLEPKKFSHLLKLKKNLPSAFYFTNIMDSKIYGRCLSPGCPCQSFCEDVEHQLTSCKYCKCLSSQHDWTGVISNGITRWFSSLHSNSPQAVTALPAPANLVTPRCNSFSSIPTERSNIFSPRQLNPSPTQNVQPSMLLKGTSNNVSRKRIGVNVAPSNNKKWSSKSFRLPFLQLFFLPNGAKPSFNAFDRLELEKNLQYYSSFPYHSGAFEVLITMESFISNYLHLISDPTLKDQFSNGMFQFQRYDGVKVPLKELPYSHRNFPNDLEIWKAWATDSKTKPIVVTPHLIITKRPSLSSSEDDYLCAFDSNGNQLLDFDRSDNFPDGLLKDEYVFCVECLVN